MKKIVFLKSVAVLMMIGGFGVIWFGLSIK
jgi:hypothetical protein